MNFSVLIEIEGGLTAWVEILGIGGRVTTEIRCNRRPTAEEQSAIEAALEEIIRRETGNRAVIASSQHFRDEAELQKSKRMLLGGGQG